MEVKRTTKVIYKNAWKNVNKMAYVLTQKNVYFVLMQVL